MRTTYTFCGIPVLALLCLVGCSPGGGQVDSTAAPATAADTAIVAGAKDATVATVAKECLGCHAQAVSLADIPASEMPSAISAIILGKVSHPSAVPKLTDDQVVELAKLLQPPES